MKFANIERHINALQAPLEPDEVTAMCRRALGLRVQLLSSELMTSGRFNTTYRLSFSDHPPLILRVAPPAGVLVFRHERLLLHRECAVEPHLAGLGAVIPQIIYADLSGSFLPRAFVLMNCLEGELWDNITPRLDALEANELWRQFGGLVRRIHEIRGQRYGFPEPLAAYTRYSDWLLALVDGMRQDLEEQNVVVDGLDSFCRLLLSGRALIDRVDAPRLVHGDLWPRNILVARRSGHFVISGILDAERAFWGEPLAEWIFAFLDIPEAFWQSYGADLRTAALDPAGLFRLRCYEARGSLQLILEACRYGFDIAFAQRNFVSSLAEMERLLSTLPMSGHCLFASGAGSGITSTSI